jgi:hypothetical protein
MRHADGGKKSELDGGRWTVVKKGMWNAAGGTRKEEGTGWSSFPKAFHLS